MKKNKISRLAVGAMALVICPMAFAATPTAVKWNWQANPTQGTSVTNALNWFAPDNWNGNEPVDSNVLLADFTGGPNATRYVKFDDKDVTVADIQTSVSGTFTTNSAQKLVVISDRKFIFDRTGDIGAAAPHGVMLYADTSWTKTTYPKSVIFCGDIATAANANTSLGIALGFPLEIRCDLYANSSDPVRTNAFGFTAMTLNAGDVTLVAPHGSGEVKGVWSQTEGSSYLFRAGGAHVLCAGTKVSGDGIPQGAFLKRIFSDGVIELSEKVTATKDANELTFAAFEPRVTHECTLQSGQSGVHQLRVMKWDDQTDFRLVLKGISNSKADSTYAFDVKEGARPGTIVVKRAGDMKGAVRLGKCRLEFDAPSPSFSAAADVRVSTASAIAQLVVSNGLSASIANFSQNAGTIEKEGEGVLTLNLNGPEDQYTGSVSVRGGELVLVRDEELYVKTLSISNGATLHIPSGGIRCGAFEAQAGAVVCGPGTVVVEAFSSGMMDVVCRDGAKVVFSDGGKGRLFIAPPATNVPGSPAVWFDASRVDTITYANEGGVNRISAWNDVRKKSDGDGFPYATATCSTKKPELFVGPAGTCRNYVYFQKETTGDIAQSYELGWNRKVTGICSIFKVVGCRQGGGQLLGASPLWRAAEQVSYTDMIVHSNCESLIPEATTRCYVNGARRSWKDGYAYSGSASAYNPEARVPQLLELHLDGEPTVAQGFSAQQDTAKGRNGNQDLYELIVYTNRLTEAERLAVSGYLMEKWLGASVDHEVVAGAVEVPELKAGNSLGVAADTEMAADAVSGRGVVSKDGLGHLYIADCHSSETAVKVTQGKLTVRSVSTDATGLPEGAVLHLDASDETTYLKTHQAGGVTYLAEWGDVSGLKSVKVNNTASTSTSHPKIVPAKKNNLPMVDFGRHGYQYSDAFMGCERMTVRSFFTVQSSENGGGYLFGDSDYNGNVAQADGMHGLARNPVGTLDKSIIQYGDATIKCSGPGATCTCLNGEVVDGTKAYYTGGCDLLSVRAYEGLSGNSISGCMIGGANYYGGKMVGELLYYPRRLSNEESARVEAYLNKKWFGVETPLYRQAELAGIEVDEGATVDVVGGAALKIGTCAGLGTVNGSLQFAEDADWIVRADAGGVSSGLTVSGTFDVSSVQSIVLVGATKPAVGSYVLAHTGGLVGDVTAIPLDVSGVNGKRRYSIRQDGNDIVLDVLPFGLLLMVR